MGTRCLIVVNDDVWKEGDIPVALTTIYRQYDGYLEGCGGELATFLKDIKVRKLLEYLRRGGIIDK